MKNSNVITKKATSKKSNKVTAKATNKAKKAVILEESTKEEEIENLNVLADKLETDSKTVVVVKEETPEKSEEEILADKLELEKLEIAIKELKAKKALLSPKKVGGNLGKTYKKTGVRIYELEVDKVLVKENDTVKILVRGELVTGRFRFVNKNVHSPNGYAVVIVKENGKNKVYERALSGRNKTVFLATEK